MRLRGDYDPGTAYDAEDVVRFTDDVFYILINPCGPGINPINTLYWGRLNDIASVCAKFVMDMMEVENANDEIIKSLIPKNVSESALILKSSTEDSDKFFMITVDDDGQLDTEEVDEDGEPVVEEVDNNEEEGET